MPRPYLPRAKEVADLAKVLRAEGFETICIETTPDGHVSIRVGGQDEPLNVTPLQKWKANRGSA
jgi:hypothetical protein